MKFDTDLKRDQHPQASLIPKKIWARYFKDQLTKSEINLMKSKPKRIQLLSMKWRPPVVCLCILYSYSQISAFDFLKMLNQKKSTIKFALNAACLANRIDIIQLIIKEHPKEINLILELDDFKVVQEVTRFGVLRAIKCLISSYAGNTCVMLRTDSFKLFEISCRRTDLKDKLFNYLLSIAPKLQNELILYKQFFIFKKAAQYGNVSVLKRLISLFPNLTEYMLASNSYESFSKAVTSPRGLSVLKFLFLFVPEKRLEVIKSDNYKVLRIAAKYGKIGILHYLSDLFPSEIKKMVYACDYDALNQAASNGHLRTLNYLLGYISDISDDLLLKTFFVVFPIAAANGHVSILIRLMHLMPQRIQNLNTSGNFLAFRNAAARGQMNVLELLVKISPNKVCEMVSVEGFLPFIEAAFSGHLDVINYLFSLYPQASRWMVMAKNCSAFIKATWSGNLKLLKILVSKAPDKKINMLFAKYGFSFYTAVTHSDFELIKYLIRLAGNKAESLVTFNNYSIVHGIEDLRVLKYLISLFPEHKDKIINSNDFALFSNAATNSNLDILEYLIETAPNQIKEMIQSKKYTAIRFAAILNSDSQVLRFLTQLAPYTVQCTLNSDLLCKIVKSNQSYPLWEYVTSLVADRMKEIISANNYRLFKKAVISGNLPIVQLLFNFSPTEIKTALENDTKIIQSAVSRERIDVLDFLLSCCSNSEIKRIFIFPESPYYKNRRQSMQAVKIEALSFFTSRTLFLDSATLSLKTKCTLLYSCILIGYSSIAKLLAYKFFRNKYFYLKWLLIKSFTKNRNSHNEFERLLEFFEKELHLSVDKLREYEAEYRYQDLKYTEDFCMPKIVKNKSKNLLIKA